MTELLTVNEIFFSIQGESTFAGRPCAFVRLTYCNLRCHYCDTEHAFSEGSPMTVGRVLETVRGYPTELVEITGGEPLAQASVHPLTRRLLDEGKTVLIETGGSLDIRPVDQRAILIYDIKCPGSGMERKNLWSNLDHLRPQDEIKFVLSSRSDYDWAKGQLQDRQLQRRHSILFSPVWGGLQPKELAEWILLDGLPVRMQVQLHKLLWGAHAKGV